MNLKIFKAYDIRGRYPQEINEAAVSKIAEVMAGYFGQKRFIVVGRDARLSSPALYKAVIKSLEIRNCLPIGLVTTPMFYFLVNKLKAVGGIIITASHNPKEYNGLKVVGPKAIPMSGKEILRLVKSP